MTISEPSFWEYLIINDDGEMIGIQDDIPENMKREFEAYIEMQKNARMDNICGSLDFDTLERLSKHIF